MKHLASGSAVVSTVLLRQVNPVGLYMLERTPPPVATAFRELAQRYGNLPLLDDVAFAGMPGRETSTSSDPA